MGDTTSATVDCVIMGDGRTRSFPVGHAFASILAVAARDIGDRPIAVDVAVGTPSQVTVIFDMPPAAGQPVRVSISGRHARRGGAPLGD